MDFEYKGVKCKKLNKGVWRLAWPSGLKTTCKADDRKELKALIDQLGI